MSFIVNVVLVIAGCGLVWLVAVVGDDIVLFVFDRGLTRRRDGERGRSVRKRGGGSRD